MPGWTVPMRARDAGEGHRTATVLELLFDLTFVVAAASVATELAHDVADGHAAEGALRFGMVFFAIWWAWMNFTWFASAFDTDDAVYRVVTLVQMAGVLVLASGVHDAFTGDDFTTITIGYVVMRVAMISQWLRAARGGDFAPAARRYAAGIGAVQVLWLARLALPADAQFATFFVLAALEVAVPWWAERPGMTTWHPHHIAERYGLFAIIMLGECVRAASLAANVAVEEEGWTPDVLTVFAASLVITFALWWIYFLKPAGEGLEGRRDRSFLWGYGHYFLFAALVALGGTLEVAVEAAEHHLEVGDLTVALAVAVPVAAFLVLVWALHHPLGVTRAGDREKALGAAVLTLGAGFLPVAGASLPVALVAVATPAVLLVVDAVAAGRAGTARPARPASAER
ncbi:low temperature requirement protein A [Spongisporangium articulatum]|uniref:Low temperature requirement protein A n=1 Tax=Spongisporangium articulatum TaxID=3362603 RepID=A0ABW8AJG2_9ACTN